MNKHIIINASWFNIEGYDEVSTSNTKTVEDVVKVYNKINEQFGFRNITTTEYSRAYDQDIYEIIDEELFGLFLLTHSDNIRDIKNIV